MIVDWVAGSLMLTANYFIGKKRKLGWLMNLSAQVPVAWLNWHFKMYGFFPMQVALLYIYIKNYIQWRKDESAVQPINQRSGGALTYLVGGVGGGPAGYWEDT